MIVIFLRFINFDSMVLSSVFHMCLFASTSVPLETTTLYTFPDPPFLIRFSCLMELRICGTRPVNLWEISRRLSCRELGVSKTPTKIGYRWKVNCWQYLYQQEITRTVSRIEPDSLLFCNWKALNCSHKKEKEKEKHSIASDHQY